MALDTYGGLQAEVQTRLNRDDADTVASIPTFIRYAADEIARTLRLPLVEKVGMLTLDSALVALPGDFRAVRSINVADLSAPNGGELVSASLQQIALERRRNPDGGIPRIFALEGVGLALAPVPVTPDPTANPPALPIVASFVYDAAPAAFASDTDTNAVLLRYPLLYLYGALSDGFAFNHFDEDAAAYEAKFRAMLADVERRELADATSGPLQMSPGPGFCP